MKTIVNGICYDTAAARVLSTYYFSLHVAIKRQNTSLLLQPIM